MLPAVLAMSSARGLTARRPGGHFPEEPPPPPAVRNGHTLSAAHPTVLQNLTSLPVEMVGVVVVLGGGWWGGGGGGGGGGGWCTGHPSENAHRLGVGGRGINLAVN